MRTVVVTLRNNTRGVREARDQCRAGLTTLELPVQRLVLLLPAKDHLPGVLDAGSTADEVKASPEDRAGGLRVRVGVEREEMLDLAGHLVSSFPL